MSAAPPNREKLWALFDRVQPVDLDSLTRAFVRHLEYTIGKYKHDTTEADIFEALARTVRDSLIDRWHETLELYRERRAKRVYYLSLEFLLGALLDATLVNLGMKEITRRALAEIGYDLGRIRAQEPDAGLGNGGLGRLAACFLDSMTTLDLPCMGCGIRYEFGMFHQRIENGYQRETPDQWLRRGSPWEIPRNDIVYPVSFGGHTERRRRPDGELAAHWVPGETVLAMAHDLLLPGFNTRTVNNLRLWRARASSEFNFDYFQHGDYLRAVEDKDRSETISKVLYPSDHVWVGRELRLRQEYLLVSATLQDALHTFAEEERDFAALPERVFFQLNDTHPALAVAELMRLLVDENGLPWGQAWSLTTRSVAYTNHTVMPEALERWEVDLLGRLLPRHLEIIYEVNHLFLERLRRDGMSEDTIRRLSLIDEGPPKRARMANLAIVGSKAVNGVAALHTEILKRDLFRDFHALWPEKFQNKTNGITHRRWLLSANPELSALLARAIGRGFMADLSQVSALEPFALDAGFCDEWRAVRRRNKAELAEIIRAECGVAVDPESLFDVQVKRFHEYKRQLLNALRVVGDYLRLKADPGMEYLPRTVIFGGKAAPAYRQAKLIIKLIHALAETINDDPDVGGRLKVVFLPDYRVSLAERIFPASDLSEQISTAGMEASGTGNMKFMLNGALTVGTLDGANIEILEEVGEENIYIFGHRFEEIEALRRGGYDPGARVRDSEELGAIVGALRDGRFDGREPGIFGEIAHGLTGGGDPYFLIADYPSYAETQRRIERDFRDVPAWMRRSVLNTARSAKFSSDRTIAEYARDIWGVTPVRQRPPRVSAL
jgi:starch phosphorylase